MKLSHTNLATTLALALLAGASCAPAPTSDGGGNTGTGGSPSGSGTGGRPSGTGGSSSSGTGGTTTSTGGTSGGTGGSTSTGTGGSTSTGTGGSTSTGTGGSAPAGTGGATTTPDAGGTSDAPTAGGKMMITVDDDKARSTPDRLCFKAEAGSGGGDKSPKIDWTPPPAGTMSLVLMVEDLSNTPTPHRVLCNMKPTETGSPADVKAMLPEGAQAGTGHNKPMDRWYGPGAGVRNYEITIFALATPMLEGGCGPGGVKAKAARDYLKKNKTNKAIVLDFDSKVLWGSSTGQCK